MLFGTKKQVQTSLPTALGPCINRIDLWHTSDIHYIEARLGGKVTSRTDSCDDDDGYAITTECVLIHICPRSLGERGFVKTAIAPAFATYFRGVLSIRQGSYTRTDDGQVTELLLLRMRSRPRLMPIATLACLHFLGWLRAMTASLPYEGITSTITGDVDGFWGSGKPANQDLSTDVRVVAGFSDVWTAPQGWEGPLSEPVATASRSPQVPKIYHENKLVDAAVCVACRKLHASSSLTLAPGDVYCCQPCLDRYRPACFVCQESFQLAEGTRLACDHAYCNECLVHCFQAGLGSITDFPPRCCGQELHFQTHMTKLPSDAVRQYLNLLKQEHLNKEVPCATPACQAKRLVIKHYYVQDDWGACRHCVQSTCTRCHQAKSRHDHADQQRKCPPPDDTAVLKLAKRRKWRQCPTCRQLVSRSEGCNDMRCFCGQKFCYTCGATYPSRRTCACPMTFEPREPVDDAESDEAPEDVGTDSRDELVERLQTTSISNGYAMPGVWPRVRREQWPSERVMYQCTHADLSDVSRGRCHGCLRVDQDTRFCLECMVNLCRSCIAAVRRR